MELESKIMAEIGLGNHYSWFNGSGSCGYIREEAAAKLAEIIEKHHKAGDRIAPPDKVLVKLVKDVAERGDENDSTLTKTWVVASYIIAEHIHQAKSTDRDRQEAYDRVQAYIKKNYLPNEHRSTGLMRGAF